MDSVKFCSSTEIHPRKLAPDQRPLPRATFSGLLLPLWATPMVGQLLVKPSGKSWAEYFLLPVTRSEPYVTSLLKMYVRRPYSCHELFGFDIMLDENLKPWVLEVNISPRQVVFSALTVERFLYPHDSVSTLVLLTLSRPFLH